MIACPRVATETLDCIEVSPSGNASRTVIWLHGLGADGHDFEPIVPHLGLDPALGVRFVFPHAPRIAVTVNMGMIMRAWYDIRALDPPDHDERGVRESAEQVGALIARENERGVPTNRIVLTGFSQGGAIALYTGLRYPERLAGIVALSAYLVCPESLDTERSDANAATSIFQAHGTADPTVAFEHGLASRDRLRELGYSVDWKTYSMGHELHPEEVRDIGERLTGMLSTA